ncbi:2Fe-2S iron-sulfur cluster-binding protein, partial [Ralstonia pickettii]|uniref:2Fe-2S iron-sulfur cluster-binding protein n=1 Tax=Ralstonia pickettii TaxID=329 RepID=UPI002175D969
GDAVSAPLELHGTLNRLTQAGQIFYEQALTMLSQAHVARTLLRGHVGAPVPTIEFAVPHTLSLTYFPRWLQRIEAKMGQVHTRLRALNVPDERIRFEAFGPSSVARSATRTTGAQVASVPVVFRRTGRDAAWTPAGGTLLEFAEGQRVAVPSECRSGSCGTCATRVLSGTVDYEQAPDAPVEPGCALLCVARPAQGSEPLVLDR